MKFYLINFAKSNQFYSSEANMLTSTYLSSEISKAKHFSELSSVFASIDSFSYFLMSFNSCSSFFSVFYCLPSMISE